MCCEGKFNVVGWWEVGVEGCGRVVVVGVGVGVGVGCGRWWGEARGTCLCWDVEGGFNVGGGWWEVGVEGCGRVVVVGVGVGCGRWWGEAKGKQPQLLRVRV